MGKRKVYPIVDEKLYEEFKSLAKELNLSISTLFEEAMKLILSEKQKSNANDPAALYS